MIKQLNVFDTGSETNFVSLPNGGSETKTAKYQAIKRFLDTGQKEPIPSLLIGLGKYWVFPPRKRK